MKLVVLDYFLTFSHSALVIFILTGWAFKKSRKVHLIIVSVTLFAWLVIGFIMGSIGYCPLTDWHWDIKRSLGETGLPSSFIKYMVDKIFNVNSGRLFIDAITGIGMVVSVILTITVNFKKNRSAIQFNN
jgi:hypothetical protein